MLGIRLRHLNQMHIRSYLTALVLSCLVPVCLSSAYLVHYSYNNRVALLNQNLLATANILSVALDRDLAIAQASLEALATSPALASGDMTTFHAQAQTVLKNFPGTDIILADASSQQVDNSYKPFGTVLPKRSNKEAVHRIFETGRPGVSNVFRGAVTGRYLIGMDVPVSQGALVRYDLGMTLPADRLSDLFRSHELPREWLITILDGNNAIAARSRSPEVFIGKQILDQHLLQMMEVADQGTIEGTNMEGVASKVGFKRSAMTGWTVLVSIPKAVLVDELSHWLRWVTGCLALLVVFGLGLALEITRIIARSVQSLIAPAQALGRGETVLPDHLELVETSEVADALLHASELLQKHDAARERAFELWREAENKAEKDVLTDAYNRLRFEKFLSAEIARSLRYHIPFSLIYYDIDKFKRINDTYGHDVGDQVLKDVTRIVRQNTRNSDILIRWGGDEFIIILANQNEPKSTIVAEKIRSIIDAHSFPTVEHLTCSFGVAEFRPGDTPTTLTARTDLALYRAKGNGRNRVEKADTMAPPEALDTPAEHGAA
jgi:diguanylate cyclase (GGDEF)-like protein